MKTHLLRTAALSFLFIFCSLSLRSQWVSIPDTNFGTWLNANYSGCLQGSNSVGWQMDTTCPAVVNDVTFSCHLMNFKDITGISYFDSLQFLDCSYNQLSSLPALPSGLKELYCDSNLLSSLLALPTGLILLNCEMNQLSALPPLPLGIQTVICPFNQLTRLPVFPATLLQFNCSFNLIDSLPALPAGLNGLLCYGNHLTSLPDLPAGLTWLDCSNNQLTNLPAFPDSLVYCSISYNPLKCIPQLKRIAHFEFGSTNITCLPNYGYINFSIPTVNSFPVCDVLNASGCEVFWNIGGKVHLDPNSNCIADSGENSVNVPVQLRSNGVLLQQMPTLESGNYSFETNNGNYEIIIDTSNLPFSVTCPTNNLYYDTISATDSFHYNRNFAIECKPGFDLAAWSISDGLFRPANLAKVDIHVGGTSNFYGINCSGGISGNVRIEITGPANYVSPAPGALTPNNVSGNVLIYNVADFGNTDFNNSFNIMVQTDTTAPLGSQICFTVTVTPITGDDVPANNIQTHCFTVVGSFDPNDKQVYPSADIDTAQEWLTYTIRFQNTGTAEAQHIYVTDTMDADLDVLSFQLLAYSHQPLVQIKENAVRFNFPNINLPDSFSNEPLSHGYVQYKIKIKDGKPIGTEINNTAFIYFDFNAPVVTNTTVNTIATVSSVSELRIADLGLQIFPNPASSSVTLSGNESIIGAIATITDIAGREMLKSVLTIRNPQFDIRNLQSGVYIVTVTNRDGRRATKKLVIQK